MATSATVRFALGAITLLILFLTVVQSEHHANRAGKRAHDKISTITKRGYDRVKRTLKGDVKALVKRNEYSSLHCPEKVNCVEMSAVWDPESLQLATDCTPDKRTCQFDFGVSVTGTCPDGSSGTVNIHKSATDPGPSTITLVSGDPNSGKPIEMTGTFGGLNTHELTTYDAYISGYLECDKV